MVGRSGHGLLEDQGVYLPWDGDDLGAEWINQRDPLASLGWISQPDQPFWTTRDVGFMYFLCFRRKPIGISCQPPFLYFNNEENSNSNAINVSMNTN